MASHGAGNDVQIEVITDSGDMVEAFDCIQKCFGVQTPDGYWIGLNPGWDTPKGKAQCAARLVTSFLDADGAEDRFGRKSTIHLKATVPGGTGGRRIVGVGIWVQYSSVEGWGKKPQLLAESTDLGALLPGQDGEQRFLAQMDHSMHAHRRGFVLNKADECPSLPAVMVLDLCVVDPAYQRRGIASQLVSWGLREAEKRGPLDCITVASEMGRHVYWKLGFESEGEDVVFDVDEEFRGREMPPNLPMVRRAGTT